MTDQDPITVKDNEIPASASRVVLDGRTDAEKVIELRRMKKEDRRLDYKAFMEPNEKAIRCLVKDVVALANAEGGYIIIGVDEGKDYRFCGTPTEELEKRLTSSNFQQVLSEYTKAVINVSATWVEIQEGEEKARCFVIYVTPSIAPAIFERPCQVGSESIFREGDYWIRKGSVNSRATSADMHALLERVRSQERQQHTGGRQFDDQIVGLLQRIAMGLEGNTGRFEAEILELPAEQIKEESSRVFARKTAPAELSKVLGRFGRTLKGELRKLPKSPADELDSAMVAWIDRVVPVYFCLWVSAVDEGIPGLQKEIISALIEVLEDSWSTKAAIGERKQALGLQRPIAYLVVAMAALAIERNDPYAASLATDVRGKKDGYWASRSLIRYTQVMSSRAGEMKGFSFAAMAKDYFADKQYAVQEFGDLEEMLNAFLSAELLQCLRMVAQNRSDLEAVHGAWPGYTIYKGERMEQMILSILKAPKGWLGIENPEHVAQAFFNVDKFADQVASQSNYWPDKLELYVPAIKELYRAAGFEST